MQKIDQHAAGLDAETRATIHEGAASGVDKRRDVLFADYADPDRFRRLAGRIKQHTLDHLDRYLEEAAGNLEAAGATVHFCPGAEGARQTVLEILRARGAEKVVKSKSMVTEEIHLNPFLEEHGIEPVETDLGEFIVQIDEDEPSHIIKPIIHKNRRQIARSFEEHGLGAYDEDPQTITRRARAHLRHQYLEADAGITGANFVVAESGRIVIVTNEGNARFSLAPNAVHIALVGIEKLIPKTRDLAVFLNLLARSATGQRITVYTQFINGPRAAGQPDGPEEMHVIFLDNGRTAALGSDCREILRCIRCGACQNVCPVYRQASGFAYRSVYGGPVGAVLTPLLDPAQFNDFADLPKASSLCGACREVCPVDIPIPDLLLRLRHRAHDAGVASPGAPDLRLWAALATRPKAWKTALAAANTLNHIPPGLLPLPPVRAWLDHRTLPRWRGGKFRKWLAGREK